MESFMDDLLNFSVPEEEDDEEEYMLPLRNLTHRTTGQPYNTDDSGVVEEEELEWISNKDAFPVIETFVGAFPEHFHTISSERESTVVKQLSPVSVLQTSSNSSTTTTTTTSSTSGGSNGSTALAPATTATMSCCVGLKVPGKARSKRRRTGRRDLRVLWTENEGGIQKKKKAPSVTAAMVIIGRKCQHCGAEKTPQWRAGPSGPKTLCNACGVRYKSGRLVPEYRPANSPTFTAELHSNSHRKIIEMRKQFHSGDGDRKDCG